MIPISYFNLIKTKYFANFPENDLSYYEDEFLTLLIPCLPT